MFKSQYLIPVVLFSVLLLSSTASAALFSENSKVVALDKASYGEEVDNHPERLWFIMFYSNSCGHCKNFAPIFEEAAEMLSKDPLSDVRFGSVNSKESAITRRYEITGYPTTLLLWGGLVREFRQERTVESIRSFLHFASGQKLKELNRKSLHRKDFAHFVFIPSPKDTEKSKNEINERFDKLAFEYGSTARFYVSPSSTNSFEGVEVSKFPAIISYRDGVALSFDGDLLSEEKEVQKELREFLVLHSEPFVHSVSPGNYHSFTTGSHKSVFAVLNLESSSSSGEERENNEKILALFRSLVISSPLKFSPSEFKFGWIDGIKYSRFCSHYGVDTSILPRILVLDNSKRKHYFNASLSVLDPISMEEYLTLISEGRMIGSSIGRISSIVRPIFNAARAHPYISVTIAIAVIIFYTMAICAVRISNKEAAEKENARNRPTPGVAKKADANRSGEELNDSKAKKKKE